jgi:phosphate transport system protein
MFKRVMELWKGKEYIKAVMGYFRQMLDADQEMFTVVCRELLHNQDQPHLRDTMYSVDRKVNSWEKDIRKRVIEHLSFNPGDDVSMSLVLMSVVKDAERVGDYAKNLYEVTRMLNKPIERESIPALFPLEEQILELFRLTKDAFLNSDLHKAQQCWRIKKTLNDECDEIIEHLAKSSRSANEAVCYSLISRYFKRIASHLTNIATSVILPVSELDYFDERLSCDPTLED